MEEIIKQNTPNTNPKKIFRVLFIIGCTLFLLLDTFLPSTEGETHFVRMVCFFLLGFICFEINENDRELSQLKKKIKQLEKSNFSAK